MKVVISSGLKFDTNPENLYDWYFGHKKKFVQVGNKISVEQEFDWYWLVEP